MQTNQISFQNRADGTSIEFTGETPVGNNEVPVGSTVTLRGDTVTILAEVLDSLPDGSVIGRIKGVEGEPTAETAIGEDVTFQPENVISCRIAA